MFTRRTAQERPMRRGSQQDTDGAQALVFVDLFSDISAYYLTPPPDVAAGEVEQYPNRWDLFAGIPTQVETSSGFQRIRRFWHCVGVRSIIELLDHFGSITGGTVAVLLYSGLTPKKLQDAWKSRFGPSSGRHVASKPLGRIRTLIKDLPSIWSYFVVWLIFRLCPDAATSWIDIGY